MKKSMFLIYLLTVIYLSSSYAAGKEGHGQGKGHHKHHDAEEVRYYPEHPRYSGYQDPRSHQDPAGGVVGSVLGYEIGNGNPIATGLGLPQVPISATKLLEDARFDFQT